MKHRKPKRKTSKAVPAYLSRAMTAVSVGEVARVVIAHASDCARPRGGDCTCVPDLTVHHADGRLEDVDDEGRAGGGRRPS